MQRRSAVAEVWWSQLEAGGGSTILSEQETISLSDIKSELRTSQPIESFDFDLSEEGINFEELEKNLLRKAMAKSHGVVAKAAKLLGMSYKTFWYRWDKLNLESTPSKKQPADE